MKNKLVSVMVVICLMASTALGQTDAATEVVTDDATMARLRVGHLVFNAPHVDVFINGEIAMNPGQPQADIGCCQFTGYMYLTPGTYSVAIAPARRGIEQAKLGPVDVTVEAGHRYTLAVLGQLRDEQWTPLIIDETAALQEVRTDPSQTIMILINNLAGTETLNFTHDGQGPQNIPYLGFAAAPVPTGQVEHLAITTNVGVMYEGPSFVPYFGPGIDYMGALTGLFPGSEDLDFRYASQGSNISDLSLLEFLQGFSGLGVELEGNKVLSFDTFLEAVETAGLTELLTTGGPFLMFVPTDAAFEALPEGQLDTLMADPEALADVLRYHIIPGYHPAGSLSGTRYGSVDRTFANMMGEDLKLSFSDGTFYINEIGQGTVPRYVVDDGKFVFPISTVLQLPED